MKQIILSLFALLFTISTLAWDVSGTAQDAETGDPLPGIELLLFTESGLVRTTMTLADGSFNFDNIQNGSHELEFHYYEPVIINGDYYLYTPYPDSIIVDGADVTGIVFDIPPHHPEYQISGTLYDATTNEPILNQNISLRLDIFSHTGFFFAWADDDGTYSFDDLVPDWTYYFDVFENNYYYGDQVILEIDTTGPQQITMDFYLTPKDGVDVSGTLFDIENVQPIEMANRTIRITAINSMWAETDGNGDFTFVNVEPGYYANITVTTEDTAYYNCPESTIYELIVPDSGLDNVALFQQKFETVHEVTVDDPTFMPGETKTLRFSLVHDNDIYGNVWGVELYIPDHITILNTNPFYSYNSGQTTFTIDDCTNSDWLVWEGYHSVFGSGNVGNLQYVGDSVYTDVEVQFSADSVPEMGIEYHVFYSYACTGGYFSYGTIMLEHGDLVGIEDPGAKGSKVTVFPNPANGWACFHVNLEEASPVTVELYDMTGRKVKEAEKSITAGRNDFRMDMQNLPEGVYFYVFSSNSLTTTGKLIASE